MYFFILPYRSKNANHFKPFLLFLLLSLFIQCLPHKANQLKNGDLLFVTAKSSGLSGAINNVTQKRENISFDHIGIFQKTKKGGFVLHAASKGGSQRQDLKVFLKERSSDGQKIVVYRLKNEYQKTIPSAIEKAESMLGKPYNFNYILNENSYYCSDYVERAFKKDHIFKLEPMTFIDPKTGKTNEFWKNFYQKKNLKIPEGQPGCNPNGLATSEKLNRLIEL